MSKKSTVNNPKSCDCGFPEHILTSTTPNNPWIHFMVYNEMLVFDVVEGMKAELIALKTEVENVKEDMVYMKKEKLVDGMKADLVALNIEVEKVKEVMDK
uniref:Uncharacterized protein n=1 Tax=Lactuca sativa TaxID=4236 RepID=A0A9R1UR49_LACSA|nr:hypothetical protein LSAT_V11C800444980 [Lactuca sativa]